MSIIGRRGFIKGLACLASLSSASLEAEIERIDPVADGGYTVVAYGLDGRHVFNVTAVKDLSVEGWHKGTRY